jgi:hypothetical protein
VLQSLNGRITGDEGEYRRSRAGDASVSELTLLLTLAVQLQKRLIEVLALIKAEVSSTG